MEKKVNLKDLRYKKLRKVFGDIEVYNPDNEIQSDIKTQFLNIFSKEISGDNVEIELKMADILKEYMPKLSNIDYSDLSDDEINEILSNPSEDLQLAYNEISDILSDIFTRLMRQLSKIQKSTSEIIENGDLSEDEKIEIMQSLNRDIESRR